MDIQPRELVLTAFYSVVVVLGITVFHELLHVVANVVATGKFGSCQFWPIGDIEWKGLSTTVGACVVDGGAPGWNALVSTQLAAVVGLFLAIRAVGIENRPLRWALKLAGVWEWLHYSLYGMGIFGMPYIAESGDVMSGMADGYEVLAAFGQLGMIPGLIILVGGGVLVWERLLVNTRDTCPGKVKILNP